MSTFTDFTRKTFGHAGALAVPLLIFLGGAHAADEDADGYQAPLDCNDFDPTIHPGAADEPDDAFLDTNCDGIDGDASRALFVAPGGDDSHPGTRSLPFQTIRRALDQAVS